MMLSAKTGKLSLQRGRTLIEYEMKMPSGGMCSKPSRPKTTIIGLPYFTNEDNFPSIMKTIIGDLMPSTFLKEETSNDLLVHKLLKQNDFDIEKDSD